MSFNFVLGIVGSLVLVTGAALPDTRVSHPTRSLKNWCFALGGALMLIYSTLNYLEGGPIFFVFLQVLVNISSVFMMLNTDDRIDTPITVAAAIGLIAWSLYLAQGYETVIFILGLVGIAMGYELTGGTVKREIALVAGSVLIALFSYLSSSWIFFWLNVFFALFSAYHIWNIRHELKGAEAGKVL